MIVGGGKRQKYAGSIVLSVELKYPGLAVLHDNVAARPNIAAHLNSPRRIPYNRYGISYALPGPQPTMMGDQS